MSLKTLKKSLEDNRGSFVQEARCHCARQKAMPKDAEREDWEENARELIRCLCGIKEEGKLDKEKRQIAETLMRRAKKVERRPVIDIVHLVTNSINANQTTIERMTKELATDFPMRHIHERGGTAGEHWKTCFKEAADQLPGSARRFAEMVPRVKGSFFDQITHDKIKPPTDVAWTTLAELLAKEGSADKAGRKNMVELLSTKIERAIGKKNDDFTLIVDSTDTTILSLCKEQKIPCVSLPSDRQIFDADLSAIKSDANSRDISSQERSNADSRRRSRPSLRKKMEREKQKTKESKKADSQADKKEESASGKEDKEPASPEMADESEQSDEYFGVLLKYKNDVKP
jgi:hypothetical protein